MVGIVGMGRIGLAVAKRLVPCEVDKILYIASGAKPEGIFKFIYWFQAHALLIFSIWHLAAEVCGIFVPFEQLLRESDVVIITCSLNESTKNLFGPSQFSAMKPSAILINTSRGG